MTRFSLLGLLAFCLCSTLAADDLEQEAYLKAHVADADDRFGSDVAISGDTMIVGASGESSDATVINGDPNNDNRNVSGAAYVFVRSAAGVWRQQAFLKASDAVQEDYFGVSVAISGDTAVVGAMGRQQDKGGVYVFVRSGETWQQQAILTASNADNEDHFGTAVAISGNTVVVGVMEEDSASKGINGNPNDDSANSAGAAYVFVRTGTVWKQQAYLKASNAEQGDEFGVSVAISGETIAVGARGEDSGSGINGDQTDESLEGAGAVYIFQRAAGKWKQQAYLKAANVGNGDHFGFNVALDGGTLVVGAPDEDSEEAETPANDDVESAGAAYVFFRNGATWTQEGYLKAEVTDVGDRFGSAVSVFRDRIIVSAPFEDSDAQGVDGDDEDDSEVEAGAAYAFRRYGSQWWRQEYIKASNTESGDEFGTTVAIGGIGMAVGAFGEDSASSGINGNDAVNGASDSGAVYFYATPLEVESIAHAGYGAPGAVDIAFGKLGNAVVNADGEVLFDATLIGGGSSAGRNAGMFSTLSGDVTLLRQKGSSVAGVAGLPANAKISALLSPACNHSGFGVFQATVTGTGLNAGNNRVLFADNGAVLKDVLRTGVPVAGLGGASLKTLHEVVQASAADLLAGSYSLATTGGVTTAEDSGLLLLNHQGTVTASNAREGEAAFGGGGDFGQFNGRSALRHVDTVMFVAKFIPTSGSPGDAIFKSNGAGTITFRYSPMQGTPAPSISGVNPTLGTIQGVTIIGSFINPLYRATINNVALTHNEGVWKGTTVFMQKGADQGGGVRIGRILRVWPVGNDQMIAHIQLAGTGITAANNQALVYRQDDGLLLTLVRTGDPVRGCAPGLVSAIQGVDVDEESGFYAVLAGLKNVPAGTNQVLLTGKATAGDNNTLQSLRLPQILLRKGDLYHTAATPAGMIRGLTLKTVTEASGLSNRGLGHALSDENVTFMITGDRGVQELVVIEE